MTSAGLRRRLFLWFLLVGYSALGLAYLPLAYAKIPLVGRISYFEAMLLVAVVLGSGTLLRVAGDTQKSISRTMCRIILAYLLYEALVVIPVALWLGGGVMATRILGDVAVRATWLLFPVMLMVAEDEKARRLAGIAVVVAAALLVAWGLYSAATGAGGYYVEYGEVRWRVLRPGASLVVAWPLLLALSGATPRRYIAPFLLLGGAGLLLINQRSDLIAFTIAGLMCVLTAGQARRILPALVPIALLAAFVMLVWERQVSSMFSYTVTRLLDTESGNAADRLMRWRLARDFFVRYPFNDWVWSWRYYLVEVRQLYQPHNFVLEIAGREGVVGLAFYLSMFWTVLRGAWRWIRRDAEARTLVGWLVAYIVFSSLNANHYMPTNVPLLVGALAVLASRADRLRKAGEPCVGDDLGMEMKPS